MTLKIGLYFFLRSFRILFPFLLGKEKDFLEKDFHLILVYIIVVHLVYLLLSIQVDETTTNKQGEFRTLEWFVKKNNWFFRKKKQLVSEKVHHSSPPPEMEHE